MAATKYDYNIASDFPNAKVDSSRFTREVQASAIVTALERVDTDQTTCEVWFKDALTVGDEALLDALVAAHSGEPLPDPTTADGIPIVTLETRLQDGTAVVATAPRTGTSMVRATHNFCDRCTWYGDSVRVSDKQMTDSGDGLTWTSGDEFWIDMVSGRVHADDTVADEQRAREPLDPHGYQVVVKVDGQEVTAREPLESSGGDYEVVWEEGKVVFFVSQSGKTVTASYSKAAGSTFYLRPASGEVLSIEAGEADFSDDLVWKDGYEYGVWALADVVAPGQFPPGTMIPVATSKYKRVTAIIMESIGSYPQIQAVGATSQERQLALAEFRRKSRGMRGNYQSVPLWFGVATELRSSWGMELRVRTIHDRPHEGEANTITFYSSTKPEMQ
jgi:hypothetical protein